MLLINSEQCRQKIEISLYYENWLNVIQENRLKPRSSRV